VGKEVDSGALDAAEHDIATMSVDVGADMRDSAPDDVGTSLDAGHFEDEWAPLALSEPALWNQREPCSGTVAAEYATDDPFSIPDNPPSGDYDLTREQYIARYGPIEETWGVIPAESLQGHVFPYDLWASPGDDVVLRFFNLGQTNQDRPGLRSSTTVLVNYQPVRATFEYLSSDLSEVVETEQSTGSSRVIDTDFRVIDITLPGSAFAAGASNEVALANVDHSPEFTATYSRRLTVHYGGYGLPEPAPCNPPPLKEYRTYDEYRLRYLMRRARVVIFVNPMPYVKGIQPEIEVQPGETVTVYYSKFHYGKPAGFTDPIRVAMIPTMNGEPIGDTIWSMESGDIEENRTGFDIIDDRGTFEVTIPDEPGVYDVALMTWAYPFVRWRDIDGTPRLGFDGVTVSRIPANSNVLRFRVK
jgi:hypothetical protein